ncbi:MAG: HAD family hydrolase, partial [Phycisphaeraceae bacterium]|nr:HAD family hydrolase [Phycisphaeraceae bacterium]
MNRNELSQLIERHTQPLEPIPTGHPPRWDRLPDIRAVVFDVYGTMLVSGCGELGSAVAADRSQSAQEALAELGWKPAPESGAACVRQLVEQIGLDHDKIRRQGIEHPEVDIREIWQQVLRHLESERLVSEPPNASMEAMAIAYECRVNPVWPMPHLGRALQAIRGSGLTLGIISNAQFFTPWLIEHLLGESLDRIGFKPNHCLWSYRLREAKPSVHLYHDMSGRMEPIRPEQVLYIGNDMRNDIRPAAQAGMRTALFAGDR